MGLEQLDRTAEIRALHENFKTGDQEHQDWFFDALCAHFDGRAIPPVRGRRTVDHDIQAAYQRGREDIQAEMDQAEAFHLHDVKKDIQKEAFEDLLAQFNPRAPANQAVIEVIEKQLEKLST
jgi:hypothetical protein